MNQRFKLLEFAVYSDKRVETYLPMLDFNKQEPTELATALFLCTALEQIAEMIAEHYGTEQQEVIDRLMAVLVRKHPYPKG
jgi:hypothetical protein